MKMWEGAWGVELSFEYWEVCDGACLVRGGSQGLMALHGKPNNRLHGYKLKKLGQLKTITGSSTTTTFFSTQPGPGAGRC